MEKESGEAPSQSKVRFEESKIVLIESILILFAKTNENQSERNTNSHKIFNINYTSDELSILSCLTDGVTKKM